MTISPIPTPVPSPSLTLQTVQPIDTPLTIETILIGSAIVVIMYCLGTLTIHMFRAVQRRKQHKRRSTD